MTQKSQGEYLYFREVSILKGVWEALPVLGEKRRPEIRLCPQARRFLKRKGNWRINARGRAHNGRLSLFRARLSRSRALLFPLSPPLQMPTMQAF